MKIETREQLEAHIEAHKGNDVPLFSAFGKHGFTNDDTIKSHRKISIETNPNTGTPFIFLDGNGRYSLRDRHIGETQSYNDNWWFTTEEEAKAYLVGKGRRI